MKLLKNNLLVVSMILLTSCGTKVYQKLTPEYSSNTNITQQVVEDPEIKMMIEPYREELKLKMDRVLSHTTVDLLKDGFNCSLCNLVADITLQHTNDLYKQNNKGTVDMALINYGGLRRTFSAGDLTVGNIFELMPFDNELYVLEVKGSVVQEMVAFLFEATVGHPIAGIEASSVNDIKVNGKPLDLNKTYRLATTDYLYTGGDRMFFLSKATHADILNLKHRDLLLAYFETHPTVEVNTNKRIIK